MNPAPRPDFDGSQVCAQTDPELWFPEKGKPAKIAKALCRTCHFEEACGEWALYRNVSGVWGGKTNKDRERERNRRGIIALPDPIMKTLPISDLTEREDHATTDDKPRSLERQDPLMGSASMGDDTGGRSGGERMPERGRLREGLLREERDVSLSCRSA